MREVTITVTNKIVGQGTVKPYPDGSSSTLYEVPLYEVTVSAIDNSENSVSYAFEALRFGVQQDAAKGVNEPRIVGLADAQSYTLSWSYITTMQEMAWRVFGGFFIHRGPAIPLGSTWGSIGCIEICGKDKWLDFNSKIISLSGLASEKLVSDNKLAKVVYEAAARPSLKSYGH